MAGLALFLAQRTALEAGDPVGIDPARDEMAFFPLIYWPVIAGAPRPSAEAMNRIEAYMTQGGTALFDTPDAVEAPMIHAAPVDALDHLSPFDAQAWIDRNVRAGCLEHQVEQRDQHLGALE